MKKTILVIAAIGAAALGWIWYSKKKAAASTTAGAPPQNRSTTALWYGGQVNGETLRATTDTVASAFDSLRTISNAFGINFGGNGVSVNGSAAGGTQSAGSGAGLPSSGGVSLVVSPSNDAGNGGDMGTGYSDFSNYDDFA